MDHLPGVEKALSPPLVVPCLGRQGYDGQSFTNPFPRRGWDLAFLEDRDDFTNNGTRTTVGTGRDPSRLALLRYDPRDLRSDAPWILGLGCKAWTDHHHALTSGSILETWFSRVSLMTPEQGRLELEKSQAYLLEVDTVVTKHLRLATEF